MANIIVGFYEDGATFNIAPPCEQWETNQSMQIVGLQMPSEYTVSFSCGEATATETGTANGVNIPDSLLEIGQDIYASFTIESTAYSIKIPVLLSDRPIPETKANPELPTVSSEDNGKILGVENGAWSVVENQGGSGGSDFFFIHLDWVDVADENGYFQTRESVNDIYLNRNKRLLIANTEDFGAGGIIGVFWGAAGDDGGYLSVNQIYASLGASTSYLMMDIQNSNRVQNESSDPFVFTGENDTYWQIEMTPQE